MVRRLSPGAIFCNRAVKGGSKDRPTYSEIAIVISPLKALGEKSPASRRASAAANNAGSSAAIDCALGVGCIPRLERTNKGSLNVSLKRPKVFDIAGWVIDILRAAEETLHSSSKICSETNKLRSTLESFFISMLVMMPQKNIKHKTNTFDLCFGAARIAPLM
jgi:hypothetical protein